MRSLILLACCTSLALGGCRPVTTPSRRPSVRALPPRRAYFEAPPIVSTRVTARNLSDYADIPSALETVGSMGLFEPFLLYDKSTEMVVRGEITGFNRVLLSGNRTGLLVRLHSGGAFPSVYVGPEEWLSLHDIQPQVTQQMVAVGSAFEGPNSTVIMARHVTINGREFNLRDFNGNPYWHEPVVTTVSADESGTTTSEPTTVR